MEKHSARFPFCSSLVNVIFHRLPSRDASVITLYKSAQLPQRNLYRQQKVVSQGDFHLLPGIYLEQNLTGLQQAGIHKVYLIHTKRLLRNFK